MNELVFWNGKKILVTGGLGFIGSNLALRLLELGAEITIYDCLDPRSGGNMPNIGDNRDSFKILVNDIRNFEALSNAVMGIDIIFNCAAYTSHPNSMKDPFNDIEVNCKGVMNLCEACRRFNPNVKIIHVGTSTQIGKMIKEPIDELHPEFPVDIYSANKTASEKYVLIYGSAYGMRTSVVRLANTFGPRSNISTPDFGFMNYFIGLGLKHRGIPVFGDGMQKRNINYVGDAVEALIVAGASEKADGEVFFAAADRQYTVMEVAEAITERIGGKINRIPWPRERETIEIGDAVISNQKIRDILGWQPKIELNHGLDLTREYYISRLEKYLA